MSSQTRNVRGILGEKLGMTQVWDAAGKLVPVTVIQAGPCVVTQVRTPASDGYAAVQLGWDRWIGPEGRFVGMHTFGESGPAKDVYAHFGITSEHVAEIGRELVGG